MTTRASRALAAHPRQTWLTFVGVSTAALVVAVVVALERGAERVGLTMTVFSGVVVIVVLAAILDSMVHPGNPDHRASSRHLGPGHGGGGYDVGGGALGGGDCGAGGGADCG